MKKILLTIMLGSLVIPSVNATNIYNFGTFFPDRITDDWDGDGTPNASDTDDDGDGIPDESDSEPFSPPPIIGDSSTPPTDTPYTGDSCETGSLHPSTVTTLNNWSGLTLDSTTWCTEPFISVSGVSLIPNEVGALTNLNALLISNSTIIDNGNGLSNLKSLQAFGLTDSVINDPYGLFTKVFKNTTLTQLFFERSDIGTSLPSTIVNLTNLEIINIAGSLLTSIPAEIGSLTNLQMLSVNNSKLTSVPASLGNLVNATMINFVNNEITSVPSTFSGLIRADTINFTNNFLTSIPSTLENLTPSPGFGFGYNPGYPFDGRACVIQGLPADHTNCTDPTAISQGQQRVPYEHFN